MPLEWNEPCALTDSYDYEAHRHANYPASDGTKAMDTSTPREVPNHSDWQTRSTGSQAQVQGYFLCLPCVLRAWILAACTWTSTICSIVLNFARFLAYSCLINICLRSSSVTPSRLFRIGNAPDNLLLRWCCVVDMGHPSDVSCISWSLSVPGVDIIDSPLTRSEQYSYCFCLWYTYPWNVASFFTSTIPLSSESICKLHSTHDYLHVIPSCVHTFLLSWITFNLFLPVLGPLLYFLGFFLLPSHSPRIFHSLFT